MLIVRVAGGESEWLVAMNRPPSLTPTDIRAACDELKISKVTLYRYVAPYGSFRPQALGLLKAAKA